MLINTLRGLMAEFGVVVAARPRHVSELTAILADPTDQRIPTPLHDGLSALVETLDEGASAAEGPIFDPAPAADDKCLALRHCGRERAYWAAAADGAARASGAAGLGMS